VQDQADLDRLAQTDIIGNEPTWLGRGDDLARHVQLMGQWVDVEPPKCTGVGIPDTQSIRKDAQPRTLCMIKMLARLVLSGTLFDRLGVGQQSPVDPTAFARIRELHENLIEARQMTAGKDFSRPKGLTALCNMLNEITRQEPGLECFKTVPFTRPAQLYLTFERHAGWAQIKQDAAATLGRQPDYSAFGWNERRNHAFLSLVFVLAVARRVSGFALVGLAADALRISATQFASRRL